MAPSKQAQIDKEKSPPSPPINPATKDSPFSVGLTFIRTACLSLATSLGTMLPFLEEYLIKNLKLFQELKRKTDTIKNLKNSGKFVEAYNSNLNLVHQPSLQIQTSSKPLQLKLKSQLKMSRKSFKGK